MKSEIFEAKAGWRSWLPRRNNKAAKAKADRRAKAASDKADRRAKAAAERQAAKKAAADRAKATGVRREERNGSGNGVAADRAKATGVRREERNGSDNGVAVPPATKEETLPTTTAGSNRLGTKDIRCAFNKEMLYEGIRLTSAGRNIENQIATAYLPKYPKCYRKATMGFFGGDKCQEGIFWHRVTDAQHKAEMRKDAKNMNCDNNETKSAEGVKVNNMNMAAEFVHIDLGTRVRSLF